MNINIIDYISKAIYASTTEYDRGKVEVNQSSQSNFVYVQSTQILKSVPEKVAGVFISLNVFIVTNAINFNKHHCYMPLRKKNCK